MNDDLTYSMREAAHLYSAQNTDKPRVEIFSRWDGLNIPPGTHVRVVVELLHDPDPEVTPELVMEFNPT